MSQEKPPLSAAEAETLFRSSSLAPTGAWTLQAIVNQRRNPGARQQFIVHAEHPVGFLSIGPDLAGLRARLDQFAAAYPGLAVRTLGTAQQQSHDLLLQEFVPGRPLLESCAGDPVRAVSILAAIDSRFTAGLQASTVAAATAELQDFGRRLAALALWTDADRAFLAHVVLPWLQVRLISATPQQRVAHGDFLSRNILVQPDGSARLIDCEHTLLSHFHAEDWLRFGYWDELPAPVREFADARIGDRAAWTVFLALRQLLLETGIHGERRLHLDALRWCSEIKAVLSTALGASPALAAWPDFATAAPKIGVQLFWETPAGWSEPSSQIIVVSPGFHTLDFTVSATGIRQLRLDPLDVPGSAVLRRVTVTEETTARPLYQAAGSSELSAFVAAGDTTLVFATGGRGLALRSTGNDPQLYFPPIDFPASSPLRVTVELDIAPEQITPPAFPPIAASAPALLGHVEQIAPEAILGWAHDPQRPGEPVAVQVFIGADLVATIEASAFRADLRAAGLGDGRKAFYFNPRPHLTDRETPVRLIFAPTGEPVPNGTGRLGLSENRDTPDWDLPWTEPPVAARLARFAADQWPLLSVVVPVYNSPEPFLEAAVHSVLGQTYPRWELLLVDDGSPERSLRPRLEKLAALDPRVRLLLQPENQGISAATNVGLAQAQGAFVALLDHDDELTADALAEVAAVLLADPSLDVVYTDQDKSDELGRTFQPFHKPAWSPVYFLGVMYAGHLLVARTELLRRIKGCDRRFDRVQDYELMLRLSEATDRIAHVSRILYHWRTLPGSIASNSSAKGAVEQLQVAAVQAHLDRRGLALRAASHPTLPHRVQLWPVTPDDPRTVSIVIPTRDAPEHITRCLASIFRLTTHRRFEVVVVDNGTTDPAALSALGAHPVRRVDYPGRFNFSRANNLGAAVATGEILVFLNNDTEVLTPDWLQILLAHLTLPGVGAVGPMLLHPDGRVQHAGVALGLRGTLDHVLRHANPDEDGYAGSLACAREVSALTAACLMMRRNLFQEVGGMEEAYAHIYQDADLCLRLRERGLSNLCVPQARLYHHESVSRGGAYDFVDRALLLDRWAPVLRAGDPYYNRNFTRNRADYVPR